MELTDRRCLVTGGGRGIGRAIALALAREGAHVAILARTGSELDETAALLDDRGQAALKLRADVGRCEEVDAAIERVLAAWDGVDVLVNNAGIQGPIGRMEEVDPEAWMRVVQVNLGRLFLLHPQGLAGHDRPALRQDHQPLGWRCSGAAALL